jgi:hypothetical protein
LDNGHGADAHPSTICTNLNNMKSNAILIPVLRSDYKVFVLAARLVRKECGVKAPGALALIRFQFTHRTPVGIAKDYLDCIGELTARRRVRVVAPRKPKSAVPDQKTVVGSMPYDP